MTLPKAPIPVAKSDGAVTVPIRAGCEGGIGHRTIKGKKHGINS